MQVHELGEGEPEIAVVGGIHGDEPAGVRAVQRILEDPPDVQRPVRLIVANEEAVERDVRSVEQDLNRSFPGDPDAATHELRLAAELTRQLEGCAVLSLHTTRSYAGPFALVEEIDRYVADVCSQLTLDAIVETSYQSGGRIFDGVDRVIEVEAGRQGSERAVEQAERAIREFLAATGAVEPGSDADRRRSIDRSADRDRPEPPVDGDGDGVQVFRLGDAIPKPPGERYAVSVNNFEPVAAGQVFATVDGEEIVADAPFYPVLLSPDGYADVFGYRSELVGRFHPDGTLVEADAPEPATGDSD